MAPMHAAQCHHGGMGLPGQRSETATPQRRRPGMGLCRPKWREKKHVRARAGSAAQFPQVMGRRAVNQPGPDWLSGHSVRRRVRSIMPAICPPTSRVPRRTGNKDDERPAARRANLPEKRISPCIGPASVPQDHARAARQAAHSLQQCGLGNALVGHQPEAREPRWWRRRSRAGFSMAVAHRLAYSARP